MTGEDAVAEVGDGDGVGIKDCLAAVVAELADGNE
jgi:hypothetical protein